VDVVTALLHGEQFGSRGLSRTTLDTTGPVWRWRFLAALIVIPFVLWQSTTGTSMLRSGRLARMQYEQA
jgi:hypothetical protein